VGKKLLYRCEAPASCTLKMETANYFENSVIM